MTQEQIEILERAIATFGIDQQLKMVVEECAEVTQAICKYWRAKEGHYGKSIDEALIHLRQEAADLAIMSHQLTLIVGGASEINPIIEAKLERLLPRIEKAENAYNEAMVEILTGEKQ